MPRYIILSALTATLFAAPASADVLAYRACGDEALVLRAPQHRPGLALEQWRGGALVEASEFSAYDWRRAQAALREVSRGCGRR